MKMRYCLLIGSVLGSLLAGTADVWADSGDLPQGAILRSAILAGITVNLKTI